MFETAEILTIGAICTTLAALLAVGVAEHLHGVMLDIPTWAKHGNAYLRSKPYELARSIGFVLGGACIVAYLSARLVHRGRPADLIPGVTVKSGVFEPAGQQGQRAWTAIHLKNGSIVEGYLLAYPTGGSDVQEIALQKPIGLTTKDQPRALVAGVDSVVVPADEIAMIGVRVEDDQGFLNNE